jgi:hypothetical protein
MWTDFVAEHSQTQIYIYGRSAPSIDQPCGRINNRRRLGMRMMTKVSGIHEMIEVGEAREAREASGPSEISEEDVPCHIGIHVECRGNHACNS